MLHGLVVHVLYAVLAVSELNCCYAAASKRSKRQFSAEDACSDRVREYAKMSKSNLIKVTVVAKVGEMVTFSCCSQGNKRDGVKWWRLRRQLASFYGVVNFDTMFPNAAEVDIDIHANEQLNRIVYGQDHKLVIKEVHPGDEGHYFCQPNDEISHLEKAIRQTCLETKVRTEKCKVAQDALAQALKSNHVSKSQRLTMVFNLDVELPTPSITKVLRNITGAYPRVIRKPVQNLLISSQWSHWTQCVVSHDEPCDLNTAYRQRRGSCVVRKLDPSKATKPLIIDEVMKYNMDSLVACHSTLFQDLNSIFTLPDEMEYEPCKPPGCDMDVGKERDESLNLTANMSSTNTGVSVSPLIVTRKDTINVSNGKKLTMKCPGANEDSLVSWFNESMLFGIFKERDTEEGARRWELTADGNLIIDPVKAWDSNRRFACWVDRMNTAVYTVVVENIKEHHKYPQLRVWLLYIWAYQLSLLAVVVTAYWIWQLHKK